MDQNECMKAGINYEEGVARFVGNSEMYEKFLRDFLTEPTFQSLEAALTNGDITASFQAAHTLKGLTGNLSFVELYQSLVTLTDSLRGEGDLEKARSLYPGVKEQYEGVKAFLAANL